MKKWDYVSGFVDKLGFPSLVGGATRPTYGRQAHGWHFISLVFREIAMGSGGAQG